MIVVDLETSGLSITKSGIWQIGAVDLDTMEEFLDEGRIDGDDIVSEGALRVTGKTEEELRDMKKQSQKELIEKFFTWISKRKIKNPICQLPQWDIGWLLARAEKYNLKTPFHKRAFDLHSIAQTKYFQINNKFLIKEENKKEIHSDMSLSEIIKFCGIEENRREMGGIEIIKDGKPHNALEDAKLTAECFYRLIYGKNLFPEYAKFEIPEVLRK